MKFNKKRSTAHEAIAENFQRVMKEYDMTEQDLLDLHPSKQLGLTKEDLHSVMSGDPDMKISSVEKACEALLIDVGTVIRPKVAMHVLMSRRLPRLMENYTLLDAQHRDQIDNIMKGYVFKMEGK